MQINLRIIIVILLFNNEYCFPQPTFNTIDLNPTIGDVFTINICDTVSEGSSGINQIWNLSSLTCPNSYNTRWLSSLGSSLPNSHIINILGTDTSFFSNSINSIEEIATSNATLGLVQYSNTFKQLIFPMTYGSTFNDTYELSPYSYNGFTHFVSGKNSYNVDGYGTIYLPTGIYSDILRLKQIHIRKDSISNSNVRIDSAIGYAWLKANNHNAIAWKFKSYPNGATIPETYSLYYLNTIVTSLNSIELSNNFKIDISPNPAIDGFNLTFNSPVENLKLEIYDILGHETLISTDKLSNTNYKIWMKQQVKGIYFVRIMLDNKIQVYRRIQFK